LTYYKICNDAADLLIPSDGVLTGWPQTWKNLKTWNTQGIL